MPMPFQPIQKAMIVIAVSKYAPHYPPLPGTLTSAKRIADWARAPGDGRSYDVLEIDDRLDKAVTVDRLRQEIQPFLTSRIIDRLVVYFAGHGLVRSASDQFWLLTNAANDLREGVDLMEFVESLKRYGIGAANPDLPKGQLSIIADACRNTAANALTFKGDPILTPASQPNPLEIDFLMATTLGHFAFQPNAVQGGAPYCLFSDTLSEALEGRVPQVIEKQGHPWAPAILNDMLATYLDQEVPVRAAKYNEQMTPDTVTGMRRNHNYYDLIRPAGGKGTVAPERTSPAPAMGTRVAQSRHTLGYQSFNAHTTGYSYVIERALWLYDQLPGARTMPAVLSEFTDEVAIPDGLGEGLRRRGEQWTYAPGLIDVRPIFVRQEAGWTIAPLMPATATILAPAAPGDIILKAEIDEELDLSLSSTVANTRLGTGRLADRLRAADRLWEADKLRMGKENRPNAANLAAYAYRLAGDQDNVVRTAHYMARNGFLNLDLAALAAERLTFAGPAGRWRITADLPGVAEGSDTDRPDYARCAFDPAPNVRVACAFPVFRQGWARLAKAPFDLPEPYRRLGDMVLGYVATVFPESAMDILAAEFGYRTALVSELAQEISR